MNISEVAIVSLKFAASHLRGQLELFKPETIGDKERHWAMEGALQAIDRVIFESKQSQAE